jgi:hypothetical protein
MTPVPEQQLQAEAELRVRRALDHIQTAQQHLGRAAAELSNLEGGAIVWRAAGKLYDRIHSFWYRVEAFRQGGRFRLDSIAAEALAKRLAAGEAPRG